MSANKNPFYDEEDVDDDTFINYNRSKAYDNAEAQLYNQKHQQLLEERHQIENRMLQSSNSAVRAIYETEEIGIGAAVELSRQGEQLKKVDRNLDEINNTMKASQKHLTAMKGFFSGFFSKSNSADKSSTSTTPLSPEEEKPATALSKALNKVQDEASTARQNNHPALRNRVGAGGEEDFDRGSRTNQTQALSRSQMVEQKVDQDLEELSQGLGRLKCLAHGLSSELDDQLDLIKGIDDKVDRADVTIKFQTNQMNRLLKK